MATLYVVGTPIGNLGDLSARAAETLRLVTRVFAEDTRRTRSLLAHLGIQGKPVIRLDAHADLGRVTRLVEGFEHDESVALVTDAGTPGVSDPGAASSPTMAVPLELTLSYAGRRFGVLGFARAALVGWSNGDRRRGSEHAPDGADELSLGLAARVPAPLVGRLFVGVRYDELLDDSIVGLWLGTDLVRR